MLVYKQLLLFCALLVIASTAVLADVEDNFNRTNTTNIDNNTATNGNNWSETDFDSTHWQILNYTAYFDKQASDGGANAVKLELNSTDPDNISFQLYFDDKSSLMYWQVSEWTNCTSFTDPGAGCRNIEFWTQNGAMSYRQSGGSSQSLSFTLNTSEWYNVTIADINLATDTYTILVNGATVGSGLTFNNAASSLTTFMLNANPNAGHLTVRIDCLATNGDDCLGGGGGNGTNTTYFKVTATNANKGTAQQVFNATINGTSYGTTNGTIQTAINQSLALLLNITFWGADFYNNTYTNYNTSADLDGHLHSTVITATSAYDGTTLTTFSATYDGTQANTTNGTIITNFNNAAISNATITPTVSAALYFSSNISMFAWGNDTIALYPYPYGEFAIYNASSSAYMIDDWVVSLYNANGTTVTNNISDNLTISSYVQYTVVQDGAYHLLASWDLGGRNINDTAYFFSRHALGGSVSSSLRDFSSADYPWKIHNLSAWTYSTVTDCYIIWNATNKTGQTSTIITSTFASCATGYTTYLGYVAGGQPSLLLNASDIYPAGYFNTTGNITTYLNTSGYNNVQQNYTIATNTSTFTITYYVYALNTFNISFYNESNNEAWPGTIYYELVSPLEAREGNTSTGWAVESLLTPSTYTITYWYDTTYRRDYIATLSNASFNNMRLYLVDTNISEFYIPIVTDGDDQACSNLTVSLMRYFIDINGYRVVEMATTDTNGQAIVRVVPNTINYKLYFNGACGSFITQPSKLITATDRYTVTEAQSYFTSSNSIAGASINFTYNNATKTYVFSWADSTNVVSRGCIYIYKNYHGLKTTNYTSCSSAPVGSLIYTLTGDLNDTTWSGQGILDTTTTYSTYSFSAPGVSFLTSITAWGVTGVFWGMVLILGVVLASASSATTIVFGAIGGLVVLITLGIIAGTASAVAGLLILGGVLLYKLKG